MKVPALPIKEAHTLLHRKFGRFFPISKIVVHEKYRTLYKLRELGSDLSQELLFCMLTDISSIIFSEDNSTKLLEAQLFELIILNRFASTYGNFFLAHWYAGLSHTKEHKLLTSILLKKSKAFTDRLKEKLASKQKEKNVTAIAIIFISYLEIIENSTMPRPDFVKKLTDFDFDLAKNAAKKDKDELKELLLNYHQEEEDDDDDEFFDALEGEVDTEEKKEIFYDPVDNTNEEEIFYDPVDDTNEITEPNEEEAPIDEHSSNLPHRKNLFADLWHSIKVAFKNIKELLFGKMVGHKATPYGDRKESSSPNSFTVDTNNIQPKDDQASRYAHEKFWPSCPPKKIPPPSNYPRKTRFFLLNLNENKIKLRLPPPCSIFHR